MEPENPAEDPFKRADSKFQQGITGKKASNVVWRHLVVSAKDTKGNERQIIKDVTGYVAPGSMLAIMGPSGSGKTTLLDTISGRISSKLTVKGEVLVDGAPSSLSYGLSAFVPQHEHMLGTLSVYETLKFAALLRLNKHTPYEEKLAVVDACLEELGLKECANTKVGNFLFKGISGGQRKRLAIGCELITHPTIMFLDEPTSGLDAASAQFVMTTIRNLAKHNRCIMSVIHQPSSETFFLFDKLCLLSQGRVVYFGDATGAIDFFRVAGVPVPSMMNPADHFLHSINTDFGHVTVDCVECGIQDSITKLLTSYERTLKDTVAAEADKLAVKNPEATALTGNQASWTYQNIVLTQRTFLNFGRNIAVFWLRLAMYAMLCLCIGTIYYNMGKEWVDVQSRAAMLFFINAFLTFMAISGFPAFQEDMQAFLQERLNGFYGVSTFVIANSLASAPFLFLISMVSSVIVYWLAGLNDEGDRFPYFFINLFANLYCTESLMMAIAALVPHYLMGIAAGAGILGMFMLVCGFFQPVGQLPEPVWRYPVHYIAFHSYGFAGFMRNEFQDTDGWKCPCSLIPGGCIDESCRMTGDQVLSTFTLPTSPDNKWEEIAILAGMIIAYRAIFFVSLKVKEFLSKSG